jgi:hypothetical protein
MRRVCCFCSNVFGEKCGKCGSTRVRPAPGSIPVLWECQDCRARWPALSQPDTHGMCDSCENKIRHKEAA